ncbi:fasciclin-like arabinogalactan protein 6 [Impatiens glandulifera]|uniref:fasciclin-like arabinogalactan protein 6 n=1 Tax=Impatiens glandulifera TaxID=253017 RepID=UPI001FB150A4|nr:fasciclin-like arabinogalactan protein 6 [Impatiens glandulifera]
MAVVVLSLILILFSFNAEAQTPSAPAPAASGPINITGILDKAGGYNTFIKLLTSTQVANQINNQVNNSNDGMTVFAPSDNGFNNLPGGYLNNLTTQQQVQLVLYHVIPKFYSFADLQTASNPVHTQASGQDGQVFGLYFSAQNNQVNISTHIVTTQVYNAIRKDPPLAVYQVDKVLLPEEFTEAKPPSQSPPAPATKESNSTKPATAADEPSPSKNGAAAAGSQIGFALFGLLSFAFIF